MRILLLMQSLTGTGGAERMVDGLSRLISSAGLQAFETSFDSQGARRRFENSAPFHPLGPLPRLPLPFRAIEYLVAARRLRALKLRLKIDATISNLWRSDLVSVLSGGLDRKIALCHINIVGNPTNRMMLRLRPLVGTVYRRFDRVEARGRSATADGRRDAIHLVRAHVPREECRGAPACLARLRIR